MKYGKFMLAILIMMMVGTTGEAQLRGLVNKVKDKVKDGAVKTGNNNNTGVKENQSSNSTTTNESIPQTVTSNMGVVKLLQETRWQVAGSDGFASSPADTYDMLERYNAPLAPFAHIRKKGEQGNFHFARDYPELAKIMTPDAKNVKIVFSSTPFKAGKGNVSNQFTSSGAANYIYASLQVEGGASIKDALQLKGDIYQLPIEYYIYPAGGDGITEWRVPSTIYLDAARVSQSVLDFDIKPQVDKFTVFNDPNDNYAYYIPYFSFLHTNEFFPTSGQYMIGVRIAVPLKDEWGNITGKTLQAQGSFEYTFDVKNAKTNRDEGQAVQKAIQTGIRFAPKPLPKEWTMKSAAPAVPGFSVAKYNQLYSNYYKGITIVKTYLSSPGGSTWLIVKDNNNFLPEYKYSTQWVTFFVKNAKGQCYYHTCGLRQNYQGGGQYGETHLAVFGEEIVYLNCNEMK